MISELHNILVAFSREVPSFTASAVVSMKDGLSLAEYSVKPALDIAASSAYLTQLVESNLNGIRLLGYKEKIDDILLTTDDNYFLVKPVEEKSFFHFVIIGKGEWLGLTRLLMNQYCNAIIRIISG